MNKCVVSGQVYGCFEVSCVLPSDSVDVGRPRLCDRTAAECSLLRSPFFLEGNVA